MKRISLRVLVCAIGYVVQGFGIVLNTKTGWGVSPINSIPFFLSQVTPLTLGQVTIIMYLLLILSQIAMRRKLEVKTVVQIPIAIAFGRLVDFFDTLLNFQAQTWVDALILLLIANVCIALGIVMIVGMNLSANAPDAFVDVFSSTFHKPFGLVKNLFDCFMAGITIAFSLPLYHRLIGVGIGTIITALLCGRLVALFRRILRPLLKLGEPVNPPEPAEPAPTEQTQT